MNLFDPMSEHGHEQTVFFQHRDSRLRCIVAIHSTVLGPALGGLRMWPYASEADALKDALRQSRAMTYRTAIAGLNLGGGKAVLIGNPETDKSEALFRALGRFIDGLSDRYIVTEDVGTNVDDMDLIRRETDRVAGVHPVNGGSGDLAPFTALGTYHGIRAALERRFGHGEVARHSFAVQGVGGVAAEIEGYSEHRVRRMVGTIHGIVARIFDVAAREKIPSWQAADRLAEQRIASIRGL